MRFRRPRVHSVFFDPAPPVVLAHRGLDNSGRENTLVAFRQAVAAGAEYLETDVHATADGIVVAFHDAEVDRVSDATGKIAALTWAELTRIRVGGEPIPRLAEVLAEFPHARLNIDVKAEAVVEPLALELLEAERRSPGTLARLCIASFSDQRRRAVLRRLPRGVATSAATTGVVAFWLGSRLRGGVLSAPGALVCRVAARGVDAFQVPERRGPVRVVDAAFVEAAHAHGRAVHVWTVNDEADMHRLLDLGVDGLVSDRCDVALRLVAARADTPGSPSDPDPHSAPGSTT